MQRPLRPCSEPGCSNLTRNRYCEDCNGKIDSYNYDKLRGSAHKRGYDRKWRKARRKYLMHNPLCVHCMEEGRQTPATVVDHIQPHKGDMKLFWDMKN